MAAVDEPMRSPRTNMHVLLKTALGEGCSPAELQGHVATLQRADAQNKLGKKKL